MALATTADLEVSLLRPLTTTEKQYAPLLLDRAERLLETRVPNLQRNVSNVESYKRLVADVEAEMVARVFRADGSIYTRESEGDYSYSMNLKVASGLLDVLDEELSKLGAGGVYNTIMPETDGYARNRVKNYYHDNVGWTWVDL
ncbi:Gp19/Gp15/Gp42 family protein [Corynebacterium minutissimum]|uniref:Phage protein Gp19/Gp15/Gp42 n=1 Tax=Corynebacterium minutissimum TaxID=38301 RepID=A0A376CX61_9CORY|nr:Gp19/Gp15/Gp42 family protein [Corynebacterium minutissimum]QRP60677.1 hypothetical protein I6J26_11075 [Corynebacterium minutissimum]STC76783.1 Phage protein Gp19/Gp15/Gp42 [Corynebacterium minutissimum]